MRIGIVGAGIAGLSCAEGLVQRGHEVVLFDKGRGPGGRMSTRRIETPQGVASFDHGAQYFTVRDNDFRRHVDTWIDRGIVARWPAAGDDAYVGIPGMNAPVRYLAGRHTVHWSTRVTELVRCGEAWRVRVESGEVHDVDLAVIAVPAEQCAGLLAQPAPALGTGAAAAVSDPCWTVMAAFAKPWAITHDCWRGERAVGWAARNSAKPGRSGPESWVVQATPEWSRRHIDARPQDVVPALLAALTDELAIGVPSPIAMAAHLWRFARCAPGGPGVVLEGGLGLCGDWLIGPRVESAWLSGAGLARVIGSG